MAGAINAGNGLYIFHAETAADDITVRAASTADKRVGVVSVQITSANAATVRLHSGDLADGELIFSAITAATSPIGTGGNVYSGQCAAGETLKISVSDGPFYGYIQTTEY